MYPNNSTIFSSERAAAPAHMPNSPHSEHYLNEHF